MPAIRTETIASKRVHGHLAHAENPIGGVLVLPTISAIDAPMQERARLLAQAGMSALVWDPYPGQPLPKGHEEAMNRAGTLSDDVIDDMNECVAHMRGPLGLKQVAVLGFCLGGRYSLLLAAANRDLVGCVPYYPSVRVPMMANQSRDALKLAADIACPVHLVHGTGDEVFTNAVFADLRDILEKRQAATVVQIHPGAVHSFMRPDLQKQPANASAARLSWPQAVTFLQTVLGG